MFTGKRTTYKSKKPTGKDQLVFIGLECKEAERVGGYRLHGDDPVMFKTRESFLTKDRAFPGEKYPTRQEASQPAPSTSSEVSSAAAVPAPA